MGLLNILQFKSKYQMNSLTESPRISKKVNHCLSMIKIDLMIFALGMYNEKLSYIEKIIRPILILHL